MDAHQLAEADPFNVQAEIFSLLGGMRNEELHSFMKRHEDPTGDEQIELHIYTCYLLFLRTRSAEYLEQAIQQTKRWIAETEVEHAERARRDRILCIMSQHEAIVGRQSDQDVFMSISNDTIEAGLKTRLNMGFSQASSIEDLDRAIDVADVALDFVSQGDPDHAHWLNTLGDLLSKRFERTESVDDLNRAIELADMSVKVTRQGHPDSIISSNNLTNLLGRRYERTGSMDDLNRAVELADMAVSAITQDKTDWTICLNNLAMLLGQRYERTGFMDDLNRAIELADMTINVTRQGHPDSIIPFNNLTNLLGRLYERTRSIDDLNRAIEFANRAVDATSQGHPYWAISLTKLGNSLGRRFEKTGSMDDLDQAVEMINKVVNATTQDQPDWAHWLNDLGNLLNMRFKQTKQIEDLNRAIEVVDMAINATPQDHPDRASFLNSLGNFLGRRYERTKLEDDMERRLSSYKDGWNCSIAPPSDRIRSAGNAAYILAGQSKWDDSSKLLQDAVKLLLSVSPRSIQHSDKQYMLEDFAGLASMAAAAALNAEKMPCHALQLLESGRGIISGLLMEMRGDISDLEEKHPRLADEFVSLRDQLDSPASSTRWSSSTNSTTSWKTRAKQLREADQKFRELIKEIRTQPGFQNFLFPPTADELMAAADPDPIIVFNLSPFRCDAFLIKLDEIIVLELPDLTMQEAEKRIRDLRTSRLTALTPLLKWLWDTVCGPCLEKLGFKKSILNDNWPRVWWVPTGMLSRLPLHAAGSHTQGSSKTVLDRVMSSYSSSVNALIQGRRNHVRQLAVPPLGHALLVAMQETPGNRTLPFVDSEVEMFRNLCPSLQLTPITPTPYKNDVIKHLAASKIFHFAGHGRSDPADPSQSCLLLKDWQTNPLTMGDLRDQRLQKTPPFLAYLSACSTGANEADELLDEGIHLVSALQLAGFRHVVGTLWEVSDEHCVDVARVLYKTIQKEGLTDSAVCHGLHKAIRAIRNGRIGKNKEDRTFTLAYSGAEPRVLMNHYWVPYVHFGV
ncbi:MAG: hypothetical protein M1840_002701 [Geoglossum simile]|nr:MAG: hypothetical protein M1840_002701 [Geoglossum simile]